MEVDEKSSKLKVKDFYLHPEKLFFEDITDEDDEKLGSFLKSSIKKTSPKSEEKGDGNVPFVDALIKESEKGWTENLSRTFLTSNDAAVDFFFHVMEQTSEKTTLNLTKKAYSQNRDDTIKLIGSLRDIKDGKGIRRQYQVILYWLYKHHPITLYKNLPELLKLGYWKDALHLLIVIIFDGFIHPYFAFDDGVTIRDESSTNQASRKRKYGSFKPKQTDAEKRVYNSLIAKHYKMEFSENVEKISSNIMDEARFNFAREKFNNSIKYRLFHIRIAKIFAKQLIDDRKKLLDNPSTKDISLAGKWAPTLKNHFDRYTLISTTIALEICKILNKDDILKKNSIETIVYLARKFYNKEFCIPLRKHLEIPEVLMSANHWDQINYKRVSAKSMKKNKGYFLKHDQERFEQFLSKDTSKVAGATLKPIELLKEVFMMDSRTSDSEKIIIEKQWESLVKNLQEKGSLLSEAVCICDVSGSMAGDPLIAAIGLTLLTMAQTGEPWNKVCITFHQQPTLFHLKPSLSLIQKVSQLKSMSWGGSTDFQATLSLILQMGIRNKLKNEQMPKILFVFTDMEFNAAFPGTNQTNFEIAKNDFEKAGYKLPSIVFWNLRSGSKKQTSTPVQKDEKGVFLLSGWSGQLLSYIMNHNDLSECTPQAFVETVINNPKYNDLKAYD